MDALQIQPHIDCTISALIRRRSDKISQQASHCGDCFRSSPSGLDRCIRGMPNNLFFAPPSTGCARCQTGAPDVGHQPPSPPGECACIIYIAFSEKRPYRSYHTPQGSQTRFSRRGK
ncbi:hypothetical protein BABINDRAFT_159163 [Babjeviella inositovora NRRL Y-12698]|uniref:Uncharacterized protein n=1 Tax=Babjeviella inositovora NRRL Y-12698 TaxID=984486 RepID=A0A1E3QY66_9ASCO|nr:uncharacterized protein BABINDRAFT_159163 [Babjeviella inositovora NRRL Y-12698]ODQ82610.1 hypothetical protein BABINDRAFT_159163 [Babjeviella inositovora NRRL Y-12698]